MRLNLGSIVCIIATLFCANQAQAAYFMGLGDLPGGDFFSVASSVSADGSVVVGYSNSTSGKEAFRWTQSGGMVGLGILPGGDSSRASDVSNDGSVVVGMVSYGPSAGEAKGFRWTQSGGMVGLAGLSDSYYWVNAVSDDGSVVVGSWPGSIYQWEAFRWTQSGGVIGLGFLNDSPFAESYAMGVSNDGSVVVGYCYKDYNYYEACRWTQSGGMVGLGSLPDGNNSSAKGVSADGSVVIGYGQRGFYSDSEFEAFRWTQSGGMVGLGYFPSDYPESRAEVVSADGSVVFGTSWVDDESEVFVWDSTNGMQNLEDVLTSTHGLDLTGWDLSSVGGISADGKTIVGTGTNPEGNVEAWIASISTIGSADLDGDGDVDGDDLRIFSEQYGTVLITQ